jgi:putative ABC transport system permease protein
MLFQLSFRFLKSSPGLTLLNILAIAIGISVPVSVELANRSVLAAFQSTLDVVAGKANVEISGDGVRFDEQIFRSVKLMDDVLAASPSVEGIVLTPDFPNDYLRIIGIDPFSYQPFSTFDFKRSQGEVTRATWITDPTSVAISDALAKKLNLKYGDRLNVFIQGHEKVLTVRDIIHFDQDHFNADEHMAVMDIAAAQALLGAIGKLDRIDISVKNDPSQFVASLKTDLPPNSVARLPERRGTQIANMLGAFQLNLLALSLIALIVAIFLFHASLGTLVLRQRHWMGILKSLGFVPNQVRWLTFLQAGMISTVGIFLGILFGFFLAKESLHAMSLAVSSIYLLVHVQNLSWDLPFLGAVWIFGTLSMALATWYPARESSFVKPLEALQRKEAKYFSKTFHPFWISSLFFFSTFLLSFLSLHTGLRWLGFGAALFWLLSIVSWIPVSTKFLGSFISKWMKRLANSFSKKAQKSFQWTTAIEIGLRQLMGSLHRSTIAASALMTAFAMMLGTSIMIDSFRRTVDYWINQAVRADIYITPAANLMVKSTETISASIIEDLKSIPGIVDIDMHREMWMDSPFLDRAGLQRKIKVTAIRFDILEKYQRFLFKEKRPPSSLVTSNDVFVNESFANHFQKKIGDQIPLRTPSGIVNFEIRGVFYDYSTDSGQILMDRSKYVTLWNDPKVYGVALYLEKNKDALQIKKEIENRFARENHLAIFSNRDLRDEILRVFDQTFAITLGLRLIAVIVAVTGMFFTLSALISERSREWGMIRSLGFTRFGLVSIALTESCTIAMIGWVASCIGGVGIAWLLAFVINQAYFGWTVQWYLNPSFFVSSFGLALSSALLACFLAMWKEIKIPIRDALRYE